MIADVMAFSSTIFVLIPNLVLLFKVKMTNPVFLFVSYCITTKAPKVSARVTELEQVASTSVLHGLFSISIASMLLVFVTSAPGLHFFAAKTLIEVF